MQYNRKITFMPFDEDESPALSADQTVPKTTNIRPKTQGKYMKQLYIALKLALVKAYDEDGKILDQNGHPILNSSVPKLLEQSMNKTADNVGKEAFVYQCFRANILPSMIEDKDMKRELENLYKSQANIDNNTENLINEAERSLSPTEQPLPDSPIPPEEINQKQAHKRRLITNAEIENKKRKIKIHLKPKLNLNIKKKTLIKHGPKPIPKLKLKKINDKWIIPK